MSYAIYYYATQANALANTNSIARSNNNYSVGHVDTGSIGSTTRWKIAITSTGTSSKTIVYTNGDTLNFTSTPVYYLYPGNNVINYYASLTDASNNTNPIAGSAFSYSIGTISNGSIGSTKRWKIAATSTGTSVKTHAYKNGAALTPGTDFIYYLYPGVDAIYYYASKADALADTSDIATSYTSFTIGTTSIGSITAGTSWRIATTSTGSSSKAPCYVDTDTLASGTNVTYYLYPGLNAMYYYDTEANAIAGTDTGYLGTSYTSYSVGHLESGSLTYLRWKIASSSVGPADQGNVYNNSTTLSSSADPESVYYLYPNIEYAIYYYPTEADAIADENGLGANITTNVIGHNDASGGSPITDKHWRIAFNSSGSSSQIPAYDLDGTLVADGIYYIYPGYNAIYYYASINDATDDENIIATSYTSTRIGDTDIGGPLSDKHWKIASTIGGISTDHSYNNGVLLSSPGTYFLYPAFSAIYYYYNEADALADVNCIAMSFSSYVVGNTNSGGGVGTSLDYYSWRLASTSTGSSSKTIIYNNGVTLQGDGVYFLYPSAPCFLEGSTILCMVEGVEKYVPIEQLRRGSLVKTRRDGYKPITLIGKGTMTNLGTDERTENRLYRCSKEKYPELKDDLYITGCHSILVGEITDVQKAKIIKQMEQVYITDNRYRLMACIDERAEPWVSAGKYTIWNFALEHADIYMNYGVYANGGLLVESSCLRFMRDRSNMTML